MINSLFKLRYLSLHDIEIKKRKKGNMEERKEKEIWITSYYIFFFFLRDWLIPIIRIVRKASRGNK